jgi:hypothetical protein
MASSDASPFNTRSAGRLGVKLRRMGLFKPFEAHVKIGQKVLKYTPVQKAEL